MLIGEYRGRVLENVHSARICAVNEHGEVIYSSGDRSLYTFFRSCAKPFQLLPLLTRGIDKKYSLSEPELVVCAASHAAEKMHVLALESIMKKAGLKEDDLIMLPTMPAFLEHRNQIIREGSGARKIYHNCSGKHLALMLLQRELTGSIADYWREGSRAQQEVVEAVSQVCACPAHEIERGIDGCGVPVFATPLKNIAHAFMRLASARDNDVKYDTNDNDVKYDTNDNDVKYDTNDNDGKYDTRDNEGKYDTRDNDDRKEKECSLVKEDGRGKEYSFIKDDKRVRNNEGKHDREGNEDGCVRNDNGDKKGSFDSEMSYLRGCIKRNPFMISGHGFYCGEVNAVRNIIGKAGAEGVYGFGLIEEKIGVAIKIEDGSAGVMPLLIAQTLEKLGYKERTLTETLTRLKTSSKTNDNNTIIGTYTILR